MSDIGLGSRVGHYRVVALIGQGGMGTVYRAQHVESGEEVALKVLSDSLAASEEFRRRFVREARYARELDHPNVIRVDQVADDAGRMYMVMPEVRGTDLKMLLTLDGPLDARRAIAILTPIADALDALHGRGILHRDIKPGNVIVASGAGPEPAGTAYLTDFGLGKDPNRDSGPLTAVGEFVGTFQYAAPEQVIGRELDHRVDIYSLGCVLYECLTAQPPFARERAVDVLDAHLEDPPPRVTAARPDLAPEIDSVVARAMAKQPDERYPRAAEMLEAARTALGVDDLSGGGGEAIAVGPGGGGATPHSLSSGLRLKVIAGIGVGSEILVDEELVIGRQASGEGRLAGDPQISRRHARIWRDEAGFMIEDLGSTNGTLVCGRRIEGKRPLVAGETVEVGATKLLLEAVTAPGAEGAAPTEAAPVEETVPVGPPADTEAAGAEAGIRTPTDTVSLQLALDFRAREARLSIGERGADVRILERDGRWRFDRPEL